MQQEFKAIKNRELQSKQSQGQQEQFNSITSAGRNMLRRLESSSKIEEHKRLGIRESHGTLMIKRKLDSNRSLDPVKQLTTTRYNR